MHIYTYAHHTQMHDKNTASWNNLQRERCYCLTLKISHLLTLWARVSQFWCYTGSRTFRKMGAQLRSRLLCSLFEGCHSGPGSCCSFYTTLPHHGVSSLCCMLLTLHRVFSKIMDQDPLKLWAKSNPSLVISIRDCDRSSIQITNTDVLLEKSFRDHLPPC